MKTLIYQRPHRLGKIQEEIVAAVPTLRAVLLHPSDEAPTAVMIASGDGQILTLQVPDGFTDDASVQAVVDAHDPTTPSVWEQVQSTAEANLKTLNTKAKNALNVNSAFLTLPAPTNTQTITQVQTLTRECSALIRLLLGLLDSTAGT